MNPFAPAALVAVAVGIALVSMTIKLRLFDRSTAAGRLLLFVGGLMLFISLCWQVVRGMAAYPTWFVDEAYPFIDWGQAFFSIIGVILLVAGISRFVQHWQSRTDEVNVQEMRLGLLAELQDKARSPYHLLELLDIGVKEIVSNLTECSGAIFLVNRPRRQFILGSSVGLSREETAGLEHYRLESNAVSQSLELGEPLLSGTFELYDRDGNQMPSRFRSTIILPMISGMDKVGGIILMSTQERRFGGRDVRLLMPVADWLAEKVKSARLSRELTQLRSEIDRLTQQREMLLTRLGSILSTASEGDTLDAVCRKMVGVAGSKAVFVFDVSNGIPNFHGGSEPIPDISENYKTALVEAIEKGKPLIVNQEGKTDDGGVVVIRSSLVVPLPGSSPASALLFVRDAAPFKLVADDLEFVLLLSRLVALVSRHSDIRRLDLTRRKGFEHVIALLQSKKTPSVDEEPTYLIKHLSEVLPDSSIALAFVMNEQEGLAVAGVRGVSMDRVKNLRLETGEGFVGRVFNSSQTFSLTGRYAIARELEHLSPDNRRLLAAVFTDTGAPGFLCAVPARFDGRIRVVSLFLMTGVSDEEAAEWRRLLSLAGELYSLSLTVSSLLATRPTVAARPQVSAEARNQLNNHLSAILGYAELAFAQSPRSGEARDKLESIIGEAQKAAELVRDGLMPVSPENAPNEPGATTIGTSKSDSVALEGILKRILQRTLISDNLYMIAGQPREVTLQADPFIRVTLDTFALQGAVEGALVKLASLGDDDDLLRVHSYTDTSFVHIDIVRQKKGMMPPDRIAGFADFVTTAEFLRQRPHDTFLAGLARTDAAIAVDRFSPTAMWFAFRFSAATGKSLPTSGTSALKILAIDDQQVILDLITAMCQSLGYHVTTAGSGADGIQMAGQQPFDIVLTDLAMPGLSGLETARQIKKLQPNVPIILVTGWEGRVDSGQLAEAGIDDVLYKPFRIEQLTDLIALRAASRSIS